MLPKSYSYAADAKMLPSQNNSNMTVVNPGINMSQTIHYEAAKRTHQGTTSSYSNEKHIVVATSNSDAATVHSKNTTVGQGKSTKSHP